jgi:low temperature requirement protein LtrA
MNDIEVATADRRWRRPLRPRDTDEEHRASTPLELFFDLCFVVAVAQASASLHHALTEDDLSTALVGYPTVFFAIWWAWMNFTWFSSAYDNDDVLYRLTTLVQIAGALILAAGVPRAFEHRDFDVVFVGYLVIRAGLVSLWLRAAHHDPDHRTTDRRFAAGESLCMVGWGAVALLGWPVWAFVVMGVAELLVPAWAESAANTSWHPEHIAERYGLFTIIVLGETILSSSAAFQVVVDERNADVTAILTAIGALLTVAAMWWIYFAKPAGPRLVSNRIGFPWGYGHYVVFSSAAAVGAGVAVMVDSITGRTHIADIGAAAAFTIPVILYVLAVAFVQTLLYSAHTDRFVAVGVALLLIAAATFTGQPVLLTGLVLAGLVATLLMLAGRTSH